MKFWRVIPAAIGAILVAWTIASGAATGAPQANAGADRLPLAAGDVEAGKTLYGKFCQKCHGTEGEGVPRMYQLVGAKITHLGSPKVQAKSDAEIKKIMLEGTGKMEAVEDLTPQQTEKILAFERTLKVDESKH